MALCVYHETTEAVATCPVCKQGICDKCLEFGMDGMCGMCVEIAAARKASAEAARAARQASAAAAPAEARPRAATGPLNAPPGGQPPRSPSGPTNGQPRSPSGNMPPNGQPRSPSGAVPPGGARSPSGPQRSPSGAMAANGAAKPAPPKGMCAEHPDKPARAVCAHCGKRVCPYCLDLYDHCSDCRQLPACVRHESMVGDTKCAGCKMAFCKICLDGTEYCDRCRTLRQASGQSVKKANTTGPLTAPKPGSPGPAKSPTGSLAGARTPTGNLKAPPPPAGGEPAATGKPGAAPAKPGTQRVAPANQPKGKLPPKPVLIGVAAVVVLGLGWKLFAGGKPALSEEEASAALRAEMAMVQKAAIAIQAREGAYPDTSAPILDQLKKEGINVEDLPLTFKLSVGAPPSEPMMIGYAKVGESFEVRALNQDGRPLTTPNGQDVVLRPETAKPKAKS